MRVNAIRIDHYGPISPMARYQLGNFNLVYGANEDGKTLLLDAIVRMLFRGSSERKLRAFGNMSRVPSDPEGQIALAHDGDEVRITDRRDLEDVTGITLADFRNVFVVRDSDMSIDRSRDYFTDVSEKITGVRTSEIERIKKALQRMGPLTSPRSDSEMANNAETKHVGGRVEKARRLIDDIDALRRQLDENGFERLEIDVVAAKEELQHVRRALEHQRRLQAEERCAELEKLLDDFDEASRLVREMQDVDEGIYERWRTRLRDRERIAAEAEENARETLALERDLALCKNVVEERTLAETQAQRRQEKFVERIAPRLQRLRALEAAARTRAAGTPLLRASAIVLSAVAVAAIAGAIVKPVTAFFATSGVALVLAGIAAWRAAQDGRAAIEHERSAVDAEFARLDLEGAAEQADALQGTLERDVHETRWVAQQARVELGTKQDGLGRAGDRERALRAKLSEADDEIATIRIESGVPSIDEYHALLRARREAEHRKRYTGDAVERRLGPAERDASAEWRRRLADEADANASPATGQNERFDRVVEERLRRRQEQIEASIEQVQQSLRAGKERLRRIEREAMEAELLGDDAYCRTLAELGHVRARLEHFVEEAEVRCEDVRAALAIVEAVHREEEARVADLFGPESTVHRYLRQFTAGAYDEISLDPKTGVIRIRQRDAGDWVGADKLSGGTFDQLYFAIRLAIAQRMLGGKRGFFLFDDPFIKSDAKRVVRQLDLLRELNADGWQIFLFSAKKEVRDALSADVTSGVVSLIEIGERAAPSGQEPRTRQVEPYAGDLFSDRL